MTDPSRQLQLAGLLLICEQLCDLAEDIGTDYDAGGLDDAALNQRLATISAQADAVKVACQQAQAKAKKAGT